jgi:hypothetical protein
MEALLDLQNALACRWLKSIERTISKIMNSVCGSTIIENNF